MQATFLGHASVKIDDLLIDPWTQEIPGFGLKPNHEYTEAERKASVICITHNHPDHRLGAEELAQENNATVVTGFELGAELMGKGLQVNLMNIGGTIEQNGWKIHMTKAIHSATSNPSGFILQKNGKTIYHAGDTAVFSEMQHLGEHYSIDVAFLPIGDRFTMGINEAVKALKLLKPKMVIPIHYNTFEMVQVNENEFKEKAENLGIRCELLKPGSSLEI